MATRIFRRDFAKAAALSSVAHAGCGRNQPNEASANATQNTSAPRERSGTFPQGFFWGVAISVYQSERRRAWCVTRDERA